MDYPEPGEIIFQLVGIFWSFVIIFLVCECGQIVSIEFELFSDALYQCNWYFLSNELQRILISFMVIAQHPTYMQGYGNIECTRESFKNVFSFDTNGI